MLNCLHFTCLGIRLQGLYKDLVRKQSGSSTSRKSFHAPLSKNSVVEVCHLIFEYREERSTFPPLMQYLFITDLRSWLTEKGKLVSKASFSYFLCLNFEHSLSLIKNHKQVFQFFKVFSHLQKVWEGLQTGIVIILQKAMRAYPQ